MAIFDKLVIKKAKIAINISGNVYIFDTKEELKKHLADITENNRHNK